MATVVPKTPAEKTGAEDPRERLLSAAGQEFAEHGYDAATVRDICLKAGVNVAAVNYYFGDKRRLYIESVKHAHEQRAAEVPLPEASGRPAPERLHDFIDITLQRMLGFSEQPWQVRLMLREVLQPTEACREMVEGYIRPHFAQLVTILDDLCDGRLPPAELRRIALGIIGQCFLYRAAGDVVGMLVPADELAALHSPQALADHITRFALAAIGIVPPFAGHQIPPMPRSSPVTT